MFKYCSCGGFAQGESGLPENCVYCGKKMRTFGTLGEVEVEEANRVDNALCDHRVTDNTDAINRQFETNSYVVLPGLSLPKPGRLFCEVCGVVFELEDHGKCPRCDNVNWPDYIDLEKK